MSGQVTVPARVVPNSIYVKGKPLDPAKSYTLVVPSFIGRGKVSCLSVCYPSQRMVGEQGAPHRTFGSGGTQDGYEVLKEAEIVADEEAGYVLNTMVRNHFRLISACCGLPGGVQGRRVGSAADTCRAMCV